MEGFEFTPELGVLVSGLVGIIIGWAIGFFDSNLRSNKKIKQAEASAEIVAKEAQDKIAQAEAKLASVAAAPVTVDDPGLLRIKNENGTLTLDLDGARVNPLALYPEQRKRLIDMLNVMRPWLESSPIPAPVPATTTPPPPQPVQAAIKTAPPVSQPAMSKSAPTPAAKQDEKAAAAPTTMVGQINAILQGHIGNTRFAQQGLTMIESPAGGVWVYLGLDKFEGIDAVPDEEAKTIIRAAIAEWEKKYTPGL